MSQSLVSPVVVAVPVRTSRDAACVAAGFVVPKGMDLQLHILDCSPEGTVDAPAGTVRIRGASASVGSALRALVAVTGDLPVVVRHEAARYDSAQLARVAAAFAEHPEADFITCNYGLEGAAGVVHVVDPSQDGDRPPPLWEVGLAIRASAIATLSEYLWFPALLQAYRFALNTGRCFHLSEAFASVSHDSFATSRFSHGADLHLLHTHEEPYGLHIPWVSVVMPCRRTFSEFAPALESVARQVLPPGTFEMVVVDHGDGQLSSAMADVSFSAPHTVVPVWGGSLGAALQGGLVAARGQLVVVLADDAVAFPDLVEQHIRSHRDRTGQLLVAVGSQEMPLEILDVPLRRALAARHPAAWVVDPEGAAYHPAHRLLGGNFSASRDALMATGGFPADRDAAFDSDLGWRLHEQGYEVLVAPEARVRVLADFSVDAYLRGVEARAKDLVAVHAAYPGAFDAAGLSDVSVEGLDALLDSHGEGEDMVKAAAESLASGPNLFALERLGGDWGALATTLESRAAQLLTHLQRLAEARGRRAGLQALGRASYHDLLSQQALPLYAARSVRYLLRPCSDDELGWIGVLARFLTGFGPNDDVSLLVYCDPDRGGVSADVVRNAVLELTRRIEPGPSGGWADVQVAESNGTETELVRLVASVQGWAPAGNEQDAIVEALATRAGISAVDTSEWLLQASGGIEPWPVATRARFRLFAWPDWSNRADFVQLFNEFARPLLNREDAALVLRYDLDQDGDPDVNLQMFADTFRDVIGDDGTLEVVLMDDSTDDPDFVERLRAAIQCVAVLPSSNTGHRASLLSPLDAPKVTDAMSVTTQIFSMPPLPLGPLYVPTIALV